MIDRQAFKSHLNEKSSEIFSLLERLVLIQSSTSNKEGVDAVATVIYEELSKLTGSLERLKEEDYGDHILWSSPRVPTLEQLRSGSAAEGEDFLLLMGHMDTVFPRDTAFNWYRDGGEKIQGPGVIDMKGGLVAGIAALETLHHFGLLANLPIRFFFNSDEEVGSPVSQKPLEELAKGTFSAIVLECAGKNREIVTGRKGKLSLDIETSGRAGHAATAGPDKDSAIVTLAKIILDLEELNSPKDGLSVNVGVISGGTVPNSVPDCAKARVDIRYTQKEQRKFIEEELSKIEKKRKAKITHTSQRPVMEQSKANKNLFEIVQREAKELGRDIEDEFRSGVSDANFLAHFGVPVIDGLGPSGGDDHSDREWMIKESLLERTLLLACAIISLCQE